MKDLHRGYTEIMSGFPTMMEKEAWWVLNFTRELLKVFVCSSSFGIWGAGY